ncbi:universal stress protein [Bacillus tianshenii]|nr:universal stress protein [Bacillus tianshenii]
MSYIIVPIDGSDHANKALDYAISISKATRDTLVLLNVQPRFEEVLETPPHNDEEISSDHYKKGEKALQAAAKRVVEANVQYEKKIRTGLATIEIAEEAKERKANCIIMGSRGMGPVVSKALGSVSYGVLHLAPCPLTLVPANCEL